LKKYIKKHYFQAKILKILNIRFHFCKIWTEIALLTIA